MLNCLNIEVYHELDYVHSMLFFLVQFVLSCYKFAIEAILFLEHVNQLVQKCSMSYYLLNL